MATWTPPTTHSVGDVLSATDWNAVANNETFLYQAPYASYYNSVATSMTTATTTQITLGGTTASGYGFTVSSNNAIVPIAGVYMVTAGLSLGHAAAYTLTVYIYQNGVDIATGQSAQSAAATGIASVSQLIVCSANDAIGLYGNQNSGGSLNTATGTTNGTTLTLFFVGST